MCCLPPRRLHQLRNLGLKAKCFLSVIRFVISRCASLSQVNCVLRDQLEQAGTANQGLTDSLWKAREDVELCDTRLRREQEVRKKKTKGEAQVYSSLQRDCAIKLLLSSHGARIPFIASFINSFSFPVHFTAMIFLVVVSCENIPTAEGEENFVQTIWCSCCKWATSVDSRKSNYLSVCQCESRSSSIASVWYHEKM